MLLYQYETPKTMPRHAIGFKELVIDDSVSLGVDAVLNVEAEKRQLVLRRQPEGSDDKAPLFYLGTEFAPVRGVKNDMEIILAGDYILVELYYGCLYIRDPKNPEKTILFFTPDCNPADYYVALDDVTWLNADRLRGTLKYFAKYGEVYPEDYAYDIYLELVGKDVQIKYNKKESFDISMGALAIKEAKDKEKEAIKRQKEWEKAVYNTPVEDDDDFTFESDEEDDDDDDEGYDAINDIY